MRLLALALAIRLSELAIGDAGGSTVGHDAKIRDGRGDVRRRARLVTVDARVASERERLKGLPGFAHARQGNAFLVGNGVERQVRVDPRLMLAQRDRATADEHAEQQCHDVFHAQILADIKAIRLSVFPLLSIRDSEDITAVVHTQSDPTNAVVVLELQGPQQQHSELPLNGEHSPATFQVRYPRLPAGSYVLTVILFRHDGRTWEAGRARQTFRIGTEN